MTTLTTADRAALRSNLHACCVILDRYPDLHWAEDPLLAVALAVSISRDGDPTEDCIADMAVAPKFARVA
jgi:hypothetical protein